MKPQCVAFMKKPLESEWVCNIIEFLEKQVCSLAFKRVKSNHHTSVIVEFWATAKVQKVNGVRQLQALVDKKRVIVTESSIRRDLHLDDAEGTDCLPTITIFEELAHMGAKSTAWNEFSCSMASLIICLATNQKFNLSKYIFDAIVKHLDGGIKFLMYPCFLQVFINQQLGDMSTHKKIFVNPFHTKKVLANMKKSGKSKGCSSKGDTALKKRVQKLERKKTLRTTSLKRLKKVGITRRVESSKDQESLGAPKDESK
ncbi:hypothetical protein Tco_0364246 [Tanacetum coccineum]